MINNRLYRKDTYNFLKRLAYDLNFLINLKKINYLK